MLIRGIQDGGQNQIFVVVKNLCSFTVISLLYSGNILKTIAPVMKGPAQSRV